MGGVDLMDRFLKLRIHETLKCRHSCLEVVYRVNVDECTAHTWVSLEATFVEVFLVLRFFS
jgi:hypothetical protein